MNPELKTIVLNKVPVLNFKMSPIQTTYYNLMIQGSFSISSLFEFCRKTGEPIRFREMWSLIWHLDQQKLLIEPKISEWQASNLDAKINTISIGHAGIHEKATINDLKHLPFFRNLKDDIVKHFAEHSSVHNIDSGLYLCRQGSTDRTLFFLLEGQVNIYRQTDKNERLLLARADKGAILGEVGFFLGEPRSADLIVSKPGKVIQLHYNDHLGEVIRKDSARQLKERFVFLNALMKSPTFANLSDLTFDALLKSGSSLQLSENQVLFKQGDLSDSFYVIAQGSVVVIQNGQRINVLRSGDSFGEIAFLQMDQRRTATVMAQSPTVLMQIPYFQLIQLLFSNLALGIVIENQAIERVTKDRSRSAS